jgi:hypothetical protein
VFDFKNFDTQPVYVSILLNQGGNSYIGPGAEFRSQAWLPGQVLRAMSSFDFNPLPGTIQAHPDFSTSGAPMTFGLVTSSTSSPYWDVIGQRRQRVCPHPDPCYWEEVDVYGWVARAVTFGIDNFGVSFRTVAGPATHVVLAPFPLPLHAGTPFSVRVTALDGNNNKDYGFHDTVCFSSTDPRATLPPCYTFTAGRQDTDNGEHVFNNEFTLRTALRDGLRPIVTGTDTRDPRINGFFIADVIPDVARTLELSVSMIMEAGRNYEVRVTAKDQFENVATGYGGTVTFSSSDAAAVLPIPNPYTFTAADQGMKTWSVPNGVTIFSEGPQTIGVVDNGNPPLSRTVPVFVFSHFDVAAPDSATSGTAFDTTVVALDSQGNVATGYLGTVHFSSTDDASQLPEDYTFTAEDNGIHTFSGGVTLFTEGDQDVIVTDTQAGTLIGMATVTTIPDGGSSPSGGSGKNQRLPGRKLPPSVTGLNEAPSMGVSIPTGKSLRAAAITDYWANTANYWGVRGPSPLSDRSAAPNDSSSVFDNGRGDAFLHPKPSNTNHDFYRLGIVLETVDPGTDHSIWI